MGQFYGLPTSVGSGMTDAKLPDAQYGLEKALSFTLAAHAGGANRLCEFGGMVGSLMGGCSFESMVIDDEAGGMILRTLRGIEVSDETLGGVDVIHQCAIDPGHFLGNDHTLAYMNTEYVYPSLMDRERTDTWKVRARPTCSTGQSSNPAASWIATFRTTSRGRCQGSGRVRHSDVPPRRDAAPPRCTFQNRLNRRSSPC